MTTKTTLLLITTSACFALCLTAMDGEVAWKKSMDDRGRFIDDQRKALQKLEEHKKLPNTMGECIKELEASLEATSSTLNQLETLRNAPTQAAPTFFEQAKTFAYYILWAAWNK
jgi:hypothetical protein